MSCDSLSQAFISLNVSMGALPEGFCPATMQDLANSIASRLIITPNQAFSTFAIGSVEPTSNIGPWLKNCTEWFVFDDATGRYIPITKGGFSNMQYFSASGNFIVPDNIYKIKFTAWGGGGGGSVGGSQAGSGGGGGAFGVSIMNVVPGQNISIVIGAGGGGGAIGTNGGDTTILGAIAGGGKGSPSITVAGMGGTASGFQINIAGGPALANLTAGNTNSDSSGGDAGGWGGAGGQQTASATAAGRSGVAPGGGGSGGAQGANTDPGNGAGGGALIEW